jgi:hypothetical protein
MFSVLILVALFISSVPPLQTELMAGPLNIGSEFLWAKGMRGTSNDGGWSIAVDLEGNVYTTGYFQGTVDFDPGEYTYNLTSAGGLDIFVSKVDSGGNFLWAKRVGGTNADRGNGLAVDSLGNVYTTGSFYHSIDFDPGPGTYLLGSEDAFSDVFVLKLDKFGNFVWAMRMVGAYGGGVLDEGWSVAVGSGFNVYVTGGFTFGDDIGVFQSAFVAKLDSGGHILWGKHLGGPRDNAEFEYGYGVAVDSDGNVYTTGFLNSGSLQSGPFYPIAAGESAEIAVSKSSGIVGTLETNTLESFDIFVCKLNGNGDFLWTKIIGGTGHDKGYGIAVDSSGNVYTTGAFAVTVDFDPGVDTFNLTAGGGLDIFVSKLNGSGGFVWAKRMGGASNDEGHSLVLDSVYNVYTTGMFQGAADFDPGSGTSILTGAGGLDIFVSTLDSSGNFVGAKSMGGTSSDEGWGIALDFIGNVHTTGRFAGTADFDPGVGTANLISAGSYDIFVSKLSAFVSLSGLAVTSPNGGESWTAGSSHNIAWTTTGTVANVKLEYSTNNGTNWTTIIASMTNTNSYAWTVPAAVSANCLVRVSEAATGIPTDRSNAVFAITLASVPTIGLSKTSFNFGAERYGTPTPAESSIITNIGIGILNWTATPSTDWISVLPGSGAGSGVLTIGISRTDMSPGYYTGTIAITDSNASNSPQMISVGLDVIPVGNDSPPFGNYATPIDGSTVASSIAVTGWVLDDVGVQSVKIYRGTGLTDRVFIGNAVFSRGSRPDVEAAYPGYPQNDRAGWGYMLLTNFLPNGGNGPFTLLAYAIDTGGHEVLLGGKAITCDNLNAVKPFGAIDTPTQGGTASGAAFVNFGWALTPQPKNIPVDGSTITVWIDGLPLGHPTYNNPRADIAALFPGYANTSGAVGYYYLNTTGFENRVHTIAWSVGDSAGAADGIGSRYFTIQNVAGESAQNRSETTNSGGTGTTDSLQVSSAQQNGWIRSAAEIAAIPEDGRTAVYVKRGYREDHPAETVFPGTDGTIRIQIPEISRFVISLGKNETKESEAEKEARSRRILSGLAGAQGTSRYEAYELVLGQLRPLPIGASFDSSVGAFYWQPGPGYLGEYKFVFIDKEKAMRQVISIRIIPERGSDK